MERIDATRFRLAIVRLARRQRQQSGIDLTLSMQSALATVDRCGPMTLGALANAERVTAPTITRIIGKLEVMGLVSRTADEQDRRVVRVAMTDDGRRQLAESRERRDAWLRDRLATLDDDDLAALAAAVEPMERLLAVADETEIR